MTAAAAGAVILLIATGPREGQSTAPDPPPGAHHLVRGAFHIHTTRSDGALDKRAVAAAAARAGLQFAVFTDHGDGTRAPDPPEYIDRVLCLDGVEISTNGGHYAAFGIPASPYPLGGEAEAVVEDVARLGGFGAAAHPASARDELAWSAWDAPIDAIEWLNADSEWRDEGRLRLARTLVDYMWRPSAALASLFDRPAGALARWDALARGRPVVAIAGHDAHGGLGQESGSRGRRLHIPSYEATFRTFSLYASPDARFTWDAARDAALLVDAFRKGRVFTAIDAIAGPAWLEYTATAGGGETVRQGDTLSPAGGTAHFRIRAAVPPGARTVLLHDGRAVAEADGGVLDHDASLPGAYRVEIHAPAAPGAPPVPWLVSNPIYRGFPGSGPPDRDPGPGEMSARVPVAGGWRVEASPGSTAELVQQGGSVSLAYELAGGAESSQFVAAVTDLGGLLATPPARDAAHLMFRGRAAAPMRVSVQLRFAADGGERWMRSVYLDSRAREIVVPLARLRPAEGAGPRPPLDRATSLLFVVDLTNARPGAKGTLTLGDVGFAHAGG